MLVDRVGRTGVQAWEEGMVRGLTDKESLVATMSETRAHREILARVKALAAKGSRGASQLTADETQELCGSVVHLIEKRQIG